MTVEGFDIEAGWDWLMIDGRWYSGPSDAPLDQLDWIRDIFPGYPIGTMQYTRPPSGNVSRIQWFSDRSVERQGWGMCPARPWVITGNGCVSNGTCINSNGYDSTGYSGNNNCSIHFPEPLYMTVEGFDIEAGWD